VVGVPELPAHVDAPSFLVLDERTHGEPAVDRNGSPVVQEHATGDAREAVPGRQEAARLVEEGGDEASVHEPRPALVALVEGEGRLVAVGSLRLGPREVEADRIVAAPEASRVVLRRDLHRSTLSASPSPRTAV